jgi:hypothetical protein
MSQAVTLGNYGKHRGGRHERQMNRVRNSRVRRRMQKASRKANRGR